MNRTTSLSLFLILVLLLAPGVLRPNPENSDAPEPPETEEEESGVAMESGPQASPSPSADQEEQGAPLPRRPEVQDYPRLPEPSPPPKPSPPKPRPKPRPRRPQTKEGRYAELVKEMEALRPRGIYLLVDTGTNRLYLMRDSCVLREAICSTGSGRLLSDPVRKREWTFETPKGEFQVKRKFREPVWIRPDWAFIEEGMPVPNDYDERLAPEELGKYALDLGDGYLIHGTLYERALGLSVTHGCVRLGAEDLESIYRSVKIGTPVYIF